MADEPQTQPQTTQPQTSHWWQTMPAIMGGVATLLTAVTGMIVALKPSEAPKISTPAVTPAAAQTQAPALASPSSPVDANYTTSNDDGKKPPKRHGKGQKKKPD